MFGALFHSVMMSGAAPSGGGNLLLDNLAVAPYLAFSTRKLRTAYAGSAIRVRRDSDNAEQDIGFSGNGLDTTSLTAFVGGGNGYVTTWYNQAAGQTANVTQTTTTEQPLIVSSGAVQLFKAGGKPAISFIGGGHGLNGSITTGAPSDFAFSTMVNIPSGVTEGTNARILSYVGSNSGAYDYGGTGKNFALNTNAGSSTGVTYTISRAGNYASAPAASTGKNQVLVYADAATQNMSLSVNGGAGVGVGTGLGSLDANGTFWIGSDIFGEAYNGPIAEMVFQPSYNASDVAAIAADQTSYWG